MFLAWHLAHNERGGIMPMLSRFLVFVACSLSFFMHSSYATPSSSCQQDAAVKQATAEFISLLIQPDFRFAAMVKEGRKSGYEVGAYEVSVSTLFSSWYHVIKGLPGLDAKDRQRILDLVLTIEKGLPLARGIALEGEHRSAVQFVALDPKELSARVQQIRDAVLAALGTT